MNQTTMPTPTHHPKLPLATVRLMFFAILLGFAGWTLTRPAAAQEAPAPAAATAATPGSAESPAAPPAKEMTLIQMYLLGGWSMHILLLGSIAFIGLTVFNAMMLRPQRVLGLATYPSLQEAAERLDFATLLNEARANPCTFNNIVSAGFSRVDETVSLSAIESGMEEIASEEVQKAMTTVSYLSIIAVVAPMVGLLGTVSGMIKAFRAMALGGMGRPELLADNISEALVTTAGGLVVGIPAMIAYFIFKSRLMSQVAMMTRMGGDLVQRTKRGLRLFEEGRFQPDIAPVSESTE
jgi:biopolymer transport protein ExbB